MSQQLMGLMEMEILILTWIPRKKLNSPSRSTILSDFQKQEYLLRIPGSRKSLNEERKGNCKKLSFTSKRNKESNALQAFAFFRSRCQRCFIKWLSWKFREGSRENIGHISNIYTKWRNIKSNSCQIKVRSRSSLLRIMMLGLSFKLVWTESSCCLSFVIILLADMDFAK